jgi:hypothetical protein
MKCVGIGKKNKKTKRYKSKKRSDPDRTKISAYHFHKIKGGKPPPFEVV